ncbi:acetoacetate--CoA ligase [Cryobacterium frigoriphilum]|uniref:Acetoacetate--CoA ligase n=1 Tax=Cryobacterium frigoriphilum TaxID=1259150 RepID=A0A4R8ZUU6_9MICO|nr:acetoacetate--CoA ligase [Cryobacterium frigoriphilum]TFD46944.1 acetoacetate--CoA ligase [Cryobacterium frigoriphilum]
MSVQSPATATAAPLTWIPTVEQQHKTRLWDFMTWVGEHRQIGLTTYREAWQWSVDDLSGFWDAVREYFDVVGEGFDGPALAEERMPGAVWYPRAKLNFAENVLRHAANPELADSTAILTIQEDDAMTELTWRELESRVSSLADHLRRLGIGEGDRVAAVLPNVPEAIIGLLATASLGAIWTINSPDLSAAATLERLRQLQPKLLIGVDGYQFNGKYFDRLDYLAEVEAGLPERTHTILLRSPHGTGQLGAGRLDFAGLLTDTVEPRYQRVAFGHPLWVLFSSGTTGKPKGIVHGHGGITLEALKGTGLNQDMGPGDRYYVAANTSWMVWNTLVNNLMSGASVVTYSGSPMFGRTDRQFDVIALTRATMFATGAAYLSLVEKSGIAPVPSRDLSRLRSILSTGSPLPDSTWLWVHDHLKRDVHLGSDSGGTDICSGFIGSNPLEPVRLGELQGPLLGVAVEAWSESGQRVVGELGEMVIRRPMPSMPVFFWGDGDGSRYRSSYFETFPNVWVQGDWITETPTGGFAVHGRSDATLNRGGVRLGSADIYAALQHVPEVKESLVIGLEQADGGYYLPLFVVLDAGSELTDELTATISSTIRRLTSARHVPDEIVQAPAVPVTHASKKIEVPIKKLFTGHSPETAINRGSLANPDAVDWFIDRARNYLAQQQQQ